MKPNGKIMIIDDDLDLSMLIRDLAEDEGYEVISADNMKEAYRKMAETMPQLILLDINLPDGIGFELCREIRRRSQVPIIFTSARTSEDDKVTGLDIGADDYLAKPYSLKELMSRIRSLMRRTYGNTKEETVVLNIFPDEKLEIDKNARQILKNGVPVELAPKEYDLFLYLLKHQGTVLTKEQLINEIWGPYSEVEQSTLTVHIRWLREKFEKDPSHPQFLKTVWGIGYRMENTEK